MVNKSHDIHYILPTRCYFVYCLVSGTVRADELAKNVADTLKYLAILSVLYDLPRIYLNVNLFGCLCSFYHNVIKQITVVTTIRHGEGKRENLVELNNKLLPKISAAGYIRCDYGGTFVLL